MVQHDNAESAAHAPARSTFPIVAIGASAGGLAPTVELIRELGGEPGIAIVVIHHLDPTHESSLVEILSRATTLPVATATEGARVECNHVYVVPPNADLRISQGALKVVPRLEEGGLHLPIDAFCEPGCSRPRLGSWMLDGGGRSSHSPFTRRSSAAAPPQDVEPADATFREELATTRQYLESVIEQLEATNEELRAANEEIVSSNEELRSTNEELQSAKEELQATNEELRTVNDELKDRNVEATRLTDDLANVLTSVEIPILIVGRDLRLRRFTPPAGRSFGLLATDLGRPLNAAPRLVEVAPALVGLIPDVVEHLLPAECAVSDIVGRRHHLSIRPYVTREGRIDGAVIAARDIDAETKAAERLTAARKYAEDIVETVREGLVVLGGDLRIRSANTAFLKTFRLAKGEIEGRRLDEVGSPELASPALAKLLEGLGDGVTAEGFRMAHLDADGSLSKRYAENRRGPGRRSR